MLRIHEGGNGVKKFENHWASGCSKSRLVGWYLCLCALGGGQE